MVRVHQDGLAKAIAQAVEKPFIQVWTASFQALCWTWIDMSMINGTITGSWLEMGARYRRLTCYARRH